MNRWFVGLGVVGVALVAVALAAFQPWKLFVDQSVAEAAPVAESVAAAPEGSDPGPVEPQTLATGDFISHEHATTGTVAVLELADGSRVLRIEDLDTSNGPDLRVWITDAPVIDGRDGWGVFDDGQYVELGKLKGNQGSQNYEIPEDVDLEDLTSVSIWCDRFNVSFGAAELQV